MIHNLPPFVGILIVLCVALTFFCFYRASGNNWKYMLLPFLVLIVQGILGFSEFYVQFDTHPMRFRLLILPSLFLILAFFFIPKLRAYLDTLDPGWMSFLHTVRFPVELVLYWLFLYDQVPEIMTFEGRNFDIVSGFTAPFITYWVYVKKNLDRKWVLLWNFICLGLLFNIVLNAILSAPTPFQQFEFSHPNVGVFYFPFNWLPSIIVPMVLLSHLVCIRYHLRQK